MCYFNLWISALNFGDLMSSIFFFKRDINVIILIILLAPSGLECGGPTFESRNGKRLELNPTTPFLDLLVSL